MRGKYDTCGCVRDVDGSIVCFCGAFNCTNAKALHIRLEETAAENQRLREERDAAFAKGAEEGASKQAILECQGREKFLKEFRENEGVALTAAESRAPVYRGLLERWFASDNWRTYGSVLADLGADTRDALKGGE